MKVVNDLTESRMEWISKITPNPFKKSEKNNMYIFRSMETFLEVGGTQKYRLILNHSNI